MDFKKLIDKNTNADSRKKNAVEKAGEEVMKKVADLFHSLDKDMLIAIQKFGQRDYPCGDAKFRKFENSDRWNKVTISVSEHTDLDSGYPYAIVVRIGANGFQCIKGDADISLMDFAVTYKYEYKSILVDPSVWVALGCCPDRGEDLVSQGALKFTSHRHVGDNRDWFTRVEDAMPQFKKELYAYLNERADRINSNAESINNNY